MSRKRMGGWSHLRVERAVLVVLLMVSLAACREETTGNETGTPESVPIVALTQDLAITLMQVERHDDSLRLTLRIIDFELGRSRLGYEIPAADEIDLDGLEWPGGDDQVSGVMVAAVSQADQYSTPQTTGWDLRLDVRPTRDLTQPVSLSIVSLQRVVPESDPDSTLTSFTGPWSFTFIPADALAIPAPATPSPIAGSSPATTSSGEAASAAIRACPGLARYGAL